jgi:hypothetical protein
MARSVRDSLWALGFDCLQRKGYRELAVIYAHSIARIDLEAEKSIAAYIQKCTDFAERIKRVNEGKQ